MDGVPDLRTPSIHFSSQLYTQLAATLVPFPIANFANGVLGYPTDKSVCHWASPQCINHLILLVHLPHSFTINHESMFFYLTNYLKSNSNFYKRICPQLIKSE